MPQDIIWITILKAGIEMEKSKKEPKIVSILEVENIDDYDEDTIFVLDEQAYTRPTKRREKNPETDQ